MTSGRRLKRGRMWRRRSRSYLASTGSRRWPALALSATSGRIRTGRPGPSSRYCDQHNNGGWRRETGDQEEPDEVSAPWRRSAQNTTTQAGQPPASSEDRPLTDHYTQHQVKGGGAPFGFRGGSQPTGTMTIHSGSSRGSRLCSTSARSLFRRVRLPLSRCSTFQSISCLRSADPTALKVAGAATPPASATRTAPAHAPHGCDFSRSTGKSCRWGTDWSTPSPDDARHAALQRIALRRMPRSKRSRAGTDGD